MPWGRGGMESFMKKKQTAVALCFLAPYLLIFLIFRLIPSFASVYISLTRWSIVGTPEFIGIDNFTRLINDSHFHRALINNFQFLIIILPAVMILSLFVAIALNEKIMGRNAIRVIAVIPFVIIPAVVGIMWNWMYDANFGVLNYFLSFIGISPVRWLLDSNIALISVSVVIIWTFLGYNMILYLAGLQGISGEIYEASRIDGANRKQTFLYITFPLLGRTTSLIVTLTLINVVQVYD